MSRRRAAIGPLLLTLSLATPLTGAVESDPLPVLGGTSRGQAVVAYNDGVRLMLDKRYPAAQEKFEEALRLYETLPEAHNNLAFSLRMQGAHNFDRALKHYDRALELKPDFAQAYMYRGVLFTQKGDLTRARADLVKLLALDKELGAKLEKTIAGAGDRDERDGLAAQYE